MVKVVIYSMFGENDDLCMDFYVILSWAEEGFFKKLNSSDEVQLSFIEDRNISRSRSRSRRE